jgi:hypothetical protein
MRLRTGDSSIIALIEGNFVVSRHYIEPRGDAVDGLGDGRAALGAGFNAAAQVVAAMDAEEAAGPHGCSPVAFTTYENVPRPPPAGDAGRTGAEQAGQKKRNLSIFDTPINCTCAQVDKRRPQQHTHHNTEPIEQRAPRRLGIAGVIGIFTRRFSIWFHRVAPNLPMRT